MKKIPLIVFVLELCLFLSNILFFFYQPILPGFTFLIKITNLSYYLIPIFFIVLLIDRFLFKNYESKFFSRSIILLVIHAILLVFLYFGFKDFNIMI